MKKTKITNKLKIVLKLLVRKYGVLGAMAQINSLENANEEQKEMLKLYVYKLAEREYLKYE